MHKLTLLFSLLLGGCSIFTDAVRYRVTLEAPPIPNQPMIIPSSEIGTIAVPRAGAGLLPFAAAFLGETLKEKHQLDACKFDSDGLRLDDNVITVAASAVCSLKGKEVREILIVRFTPEV